MGKNMAKMTKRMCSMVNTSCYSLKVLALIFTGQENSLIIFQKQGNIHTIQNRKQNACNFAKMIKKTGFFWQGSFLRDSNSIFNFLEFYFYFL